MTGAGQRLVQKGAGRLPVALRGGAGDAQHLRHLLHLQSAEVTQLDHLHLAPVQRIQLLQRLVQGQGVDADAGGAGQRRQAQGIGGHAATALAGTAPARMIDQHLAHAPGGNAEELLLVPR